MVAVVTETHNVIHSLEFKTLTKKFFTILSRIEFEFLVHALCRPEGNIHKIYVLPGIYAVVISNLGPVMIT